MNLEDRIRIITDSFRRWSQQGARRQNEGKHRNGSRPGNQARRQLLATRKRERQARRYHRLCAQGRKHRA